MAGLPHFKNSTAGPARYEPVYLNQFEVIIIAPPAVSSKLGFTQNLTLEHVKKVGPLPELAGNAGAAPVTQRYKFAERAYAAARPSTTLHKFTIEFELNLNNTNDNYIYNAFRAWADLIYNPMTGQQGLKVDYAGPTANPASVQVTMFNRTGAIFREYVFSPVFLDQAKLTENSLDYSLDGQTSIASLTVPFIADRYIETRVGQ
jgi:hypothetical protein